MKRIKFNIRIDSPVLKTPGYSSYSADLGIVAVFNQCEDNEESNDLFIMIGLLICAIHIEVRFGGIDRWKTQKEFIEKNVNLFNELKNKMKDMPAEFNDIVNKNFNELI